MNSYKVKYSGKEVDTLLDKINNIDLSSYAKKNTTLSGYGITDAYTKSEVDSKLSSVYKYKGSVENYSDLPKSPSVGDVYNIKNGHDVNAYAVPVREAFCSGYGSYIEDEYEYMYLNDTSMFNDDMFMNNPTFEVYAYDGEYMGSFSPDSISDCFVEQYVNGTGLCEVINNIAVKETGNSLSPNERYAVNTTYYFVGCSETNDYITVLRVAPGDNAAWTGTKWDLLSGTVDLSAYATREYIDSVIGEAMEGEY